MAEGSFVVEDFIQAILAQLDRVQDALRLKAVNRPLTYALKDLSLDFHVFAEVDGAGNVRFRPAGSNEAGASTLRLAFTTITRPMIEENTVSLAATRSPALDQLGLAPEEVRRFEGLGVRTAAQLDRLQAATGSSTVARWANVPAARIKDALTRARPKIRDVQVTPTRPAPGKPPPKPPQPPPKPQQPPPKLQSPPPKPQQPPPKPAPARPNRPLPAPAPAPAPAPRPMTRRVVAPPPGAKRVRLVGDNLLGQETPSARFNDRPVSVARATDDEVWVDLPEDAGRGTLELAFGDDEVHAFELELDDGVEGGDAAPADGVNGWGDAAALGEGDDPWSAGGDA